MQNKMGFGGGAQQQRSFIQNKNELEWSVMCAFCVFVFGLVACEPYFMFINCVLTPFPDSAL